VYAAGVLVVSAGLLAIGCSGGGIRGGATASMPSGEPTKPIAVTRAGVVTWGDVQGALSEAAGGVVLEEVLLDRILAERMTEAGLTVTPSDIEAERTLLMRTLTSEAGIAEHQATTLLERLRAARGLGPGRFAGLLRRNAMLRALVRDSAAPTAAQRDAERALHSGQRFRARILVSPSERSVAQAREQLASLVGSPSLAGEFAARAMRMSSDPSAARGGLLESISALDPAVPESVRLQLPALGEGQLSPVLATGSGFALVLMEQRLASAPLSDAEVEERLTLRLQRIAMESYAQRALMDTGLTVVEPGMAWSWENTR
jgi:hypothetical protein